MNMASKTRLGVIIGAAVLLASCSAITNHRGYIVDEVLLQSVQPGLDNKRSVSGVLGQPSFASQYGEEVWYYISSQTTQAPFTTPDIAGHTVLAVRFDDAGNVLSATRTGMDEVARISPDGDKTPTLGRESNFLKDLFGNIGTVGAGG